MRPALQRLLSRQKSIDLLRFLVGTAGASPSEATWDGQSGALRSEVKYRRYTTSVETMLEPISSDLSLTETKDAPSPLRYYRNRSHLPDPSLKFLVRTHIYGHWEETLRHGIRLEYESDLDDLQEGKLLMGTHSRNDMKLWGYLLSYRQRVYGDAGVLMYWTAIRDRGLVLPVHGTLADRFWSSFLDLGFKNHEILEQICVYAEKLSQTKNEIWPGLYVSVMRYFMLNGDSPNSRKWHERLFPIRGQDQLQFCNLLCKVISESDNKAILKILRIIYKQSDYRNVYASVIPFLCKNERFNQARRWHFFFLEHGDRPSGLKMVEPLIKHLSVYDNANAIKFTKSLVDSGVSFALNLSNKLEKNTKISREMMNLIHGEKFNITPKRYDDLLGARWFATGWVSLDFAITTVHALGIEEIGPLSLQAIALRDSDPNAIVLRITQLREMGISVGNSMFARAVETFARSQRTELLEGLLKSDQHPEELDNFRLQEDLLFLYARERDWPQFRRTLAIRSLAAKSPPTSKRNLVLKTLVSTEGIPSALDYLADMRKDGIPVKSSTISHILTHSLNPRRRSHRPMSQQGFPTYGRENDIALTVRILRRIMMSGSYVPVYHWREILRRLGMLGELQQLESLCIDLAVWYGPGGQGGQYRVPLDVPTNHPLHPLKILFSTSFQRSLVEWGFIHALEIYDKPTFTNTGNGDLVPRNSSDLPDLTFGIALLKKLRERCVHVDDKSVRKALMHRLLTYCGPGISNRITNRRGKSILKGRLDEVAHQIDEALGGKYFTGTDLHCRLISMGKTKTRKLQRRAKLTPQLVTSKTQDLGKFKPVHTSQ